MTHDHDLVLRPTAAQTAAALAPPAGRTGADLVVETLRGLGVTTVFGAAGAAGACSPLDAALGRSGLSEWTRFATLAGAGHAADGFGRLTGEVAALLAPAGPGRAVLREALAASAPLLVLATGPATEPDPGPAARPAPLPPGGAAEDTTGDMPQDTTGDMSPDTTRDMPGNTPPYLKAVFAARTPSQIPTAVASAWEAALTAPHGPVLVELDPAALAAVTLLPEVNAPDVLPHELPPRPELTALAAHWLETAARPLIVAGGGVTRADAAGKVKALAERLHATVATTPGGLGSCPGAHPVTPALLASADVLLLVGTTLDGVPFTPPARLIQIDADPSRLELHHAPALGIHADARLALAALLETVDVREPLSGEAAEEAVAGAAAGGVAGSGDPFVAAVGRALGARTPSFWDRPPAGLDVRRPRPCHAPQAPGTTGYALPAALGAATADPGSPVLAVSDLAVSDLGGSDAGPVAAVLPELATAAACGLPLVWLIRGDTAGGGADEAVDAAAEAAGVVLVRSEVGSLEGELGKAFASGGPVVVVVRG